MNGRAHGLSGGSRGATLMELLVVVGLVAVLIALLLPSVQQARETARRLACQNHLRQIGQALNLYYDVHQTLPPGGIEWRAGSDLSQRQLSWAVFILPQLEQQQLADRIDWSNAFDSPSNAEAAATVLPVFLCPSASREIPRVEGRGACDFDGIFGERITSPNDPPKGPLVYDVAFPFSEIVDGASATAVVGEDSAWPEGQWINGRILMDQAYLINTAPPFENDIRSEHPGGANTVFLDGSVHFLNEQMDLQPLAAICTRAGEERVSFSSDSR